MITHEEIAKRAREIWEAEGRPEGRAAEHWFKAENDLHEKTPQPVRGQDARPEPAAALKPQSHAGNGGERRKRPATQKRQKTSR
jgi:hypothetical protein